MCLVQVGACGSATRTSGTSSAAGAHASYAESMGPARGGGPAGCKELFPAGSLPGAVDSNGKVLLVSKFLLFRAIIAEDTEG
mgnify:CR=1 FL=1